MARSMTSAPFGFAYTSPTIAVPCSGINISVGFVVWMALITIGFVAFVMISAFYVFRLCNRFEVSRIGTTLVFAQVVCNETFRCLVSVPMWTCPDAFNTTVSITVG